MARLTSIGRLAGLVLCGLWLQAPPGRCEEPVALPQIEKNGGAKNPVDQVGFVSGVPLAPHHPDPSKGMIGIIDSGIRKDHPQIGDIVGAERDFTGDGIYDDLGHGTAVALVTLQAHYNLAPQLRVLNESPQPPAAIAVAKIVGRALVSEQEIADRMIQAIEWLAEIKVRIVNISMAMPEGTADYAALCAAIAARQDMLFVIAAGNAGANAIAYPAACPASNTMVIGAVDAQGQIPDYSGPADLVAQLPPGLLPAADYFRQEGDRLIQNNDLEGAKQAYTRGLGEQPTPELRALLEYGLGYVGHKSGDDDTALTHFRNSTEAWPAYPEPYVAISVILGARDDLAAARTWLEKGLAAGAESPPLLDQLVRTLLDLAQPEPALAHIERLKQLAPDQKGLAGLEAAAQNFVTVIDAVQGGQDPLDLLYLSADGGDAGLVRFIDRRFAPPLDAISALGKVQVLVLAALKGHEAVVRALLASGAAIDTQANELELTALMAAATSGHDPIVALLIARGAALDLVDTIGFTALMFAAEGGRLDVARRLLEAGADMAPKSTEQLDAAGYALKYGYKDVADLIAQAKSCPRLKCAQ